MRQIPRKNQLIRRGVVADAWTPLDLGVKLVSWHEARYSSVTDDGAGVISQWNDLSGNGYHLTATGTARPTYSVGTGPGGMDEILFNGSSNKMSNLSFSDLPDQATICVINDYESGLTTQNAYEITANTGAINSGIQAIYATNTQYNRITCDATQKGVNVTAALPFAAKVRTLVYDGAVAGTIKYFENGSQVGTTVTGVGPITNTLSRLYVGNSSSIYWLKGGMSLLVICNAALTDAERGALETYGNQGVY